MTPEALYRFSLAFMKASNLSVPRTDISWPERFASLALVQPQKPGLQCMRQESHTSLCGSLESWCSSPDSKMRLIFPASFPLSTMITQGLLVNKMRIY